MNIVKTKRHQTVFFAPYGRVPIRDATKPAHVKLTAEHLLRGKKNVPSGCAIALALQDVGRGGLDAVAGFPGKLLGAEVRKTYTLAAVAKKSGGIRAYRYVHSDALRRAINGFDKNTPASLKVGDVVELEAPKGRKRLGVDSHWPEHQKKATKKRKGPPCVRRGTFVDPVHAAQYIAITGRKAA